MIKIVQNAFFKVCFKWYKITRKCTKIIYQYRSLLLGMFITKILKAFSLNDRDIMENNLGKIVKQMDLGIKDKN